MRLVSALVGGVAIICVARLAAADQLFLPEAVQTVTSAYDRACTTTPCSWSSEGMRFDVNGSPFTAQTVVLSPSGFAAIVFVNRGYTPGSAGPAQFIATKTASGWKKIEESNYVTVSKTLTNGFYDLQNTGGWYVLAWNGNEYVLKSSMKLGSEQSQSSAAATPISNIATQNPITRVELQDARNTLGGSTMTIAFTVLTHLVLFGAALLQLWLMARLILEPEGTRRTAPTAWGSYKQASPENLMRGIAAIVGLLLYLGSRALGVSVPELAFKAMSTSFPFTIAFAGVVFPSAIGFIISWYVIRHISGKDARKNAVAMRVLTMVLGVVFFVYCDSWFYTFSQGGNTMQFLPNLVFVLSALLYAIFKYHPHETMLQAR